MVRVDFLVDGFNVYHSLKDAAAQIGQGGAGTRWLDLGSLLSSYLQLIGGRAELGNIYYFSAAATHLQAKRPGVVTRHQLYIRALEASGVVPILGRFKRTRHFCSTCARRTDRWEEKESDVAIGAKLIELAVRGVTDVVVLVTGDTDLAPAIRTARLLRPTGRIFCAFPFNRKQKELANLSDGHFSMSKEAYVKHQFPNPVVLPDSRELSRPEGW